MKLNNQSGEALLEIILLTAAMLGILMVFTMDLFPSEPAPVIQTEAVVIEVKKGFTVETSEDGDIYYYHCDANAKNVIDGSIATYRFEVGSEVESKIYCDALKKDADYVFTHGEYYNDDIAVATDYKLIESTAAKK